MNRALAEQLLSSMIAPVSSKLFFRDTFGKSPMHSQPVDNLARHQLLGPSPAELILREFAYCGQRIISHASSPSGPPPSLESLSSSEAFARKVEEFHARGYTVRLPEVRHFSPRLYELVRAIEYTFKRRAAPDLYWSKAGASAPVHHDDYELFAIQLSGEKLWRISLEQPELMNPWRSFHTGSQVLGKHVEVLMKPGAVLYLPRGVIHTVESITDSIHVSIGCTPITQRELMIACVDHLSDLDPSLLNVVDLDFGGLHEIGNMAEGLAGARGGFVKLLGQAHSELFVRSSMERYWSRTIASLHALKPGQASSISGSTRVRHSLGAISHITEHDGLLDFAYPGGHLFINAAAEVAVRFVASTLEFRVSEVPELPDDVRIAFINKFLERGFLEVVS